MLFSAIFCFVFNFCDFSVFFFFFLYCVKLATSLGSWYRCLSSPGIHHLVWQLRNLPVDDESLISLNVSCLISAFLAQAFHVQNQFKVMQYIEKGTMQQCTFLDIDENIQKITKKTIRILDHFSVVTFECLDQLWSMRCHFKAVKSSNTSITKLKVNFICQVYLDLLHHS